MNAFNKLACTLLIATNFINTNKATCSGIPVPIIIWTNYYPTIDLNNIDNLVNIAVEILSNIHACLNYHNEINIAIQSFISNRYIVDYNQLNTTMYEIMKEYKDNFVVVLARDYNISIRDINSLHTVCYELCDQYFRNALYYKQFITSNNILDVSLQRSKDNSNAMKSTSTEVRFAPYMKRKQMMEYINYYFPNINKSIKDSIKYFEECLIYLEQNFSYYRNREVVNTSNKLRKIIKYVLKYLYTEKECLSKLK